MVSVELQRSAYLYRIEHKTTGLSPFESEDLDRAVFQKGFYPEKAELPVFDVDLEIVDMDEAITNVRFAFLSLAWLLTMVQDQDVLDQFGFQIRLMQVDTFLVMGHQALYLERDVVSQQTISFRGLNMDRAGLYTCFPTRIIISTQDALEAFSRRLPGLHRPKEVGLGFLVIAIPYLITHKDFATVCHEIVDGFYCDDVVIRQELAESSIKYSLEELSIAFLEMCEIVYAEMHHLGAYQFDGLFPYEIDHQGRSTVADGLVLKRMSFQDFNNYAEEREH